MAQLAAALLCAAFGAVYELCSHGVFSFFMLYAFLIPLAGDALPSFALALFARGRLPGRVCVNLYNAALVTWTVGCLFQGALQIYGTQSGLTRVYALAGGLLLVAAVACHLLGPRIVAWRFRPRRGGR